MFLVRLVRHLFALPFSILATVAGFFSPGMAGQLHYLAWLVGGQGQSGLSALVKFLSIEGPAAVRVRALAMLGRQPSAIIAAYTGILAMEAGDVVEAEGLADLARSLGRDPDCLTELLEFQIAAARTTDIRENWRVAAALADRRDLSPTVSRMALSSLMWLELSQGQLDQARMRAEHMLEVADDPQAEIVLETIHLQAGRDAQARACTARAESATPANRLYWRCLASHAVGLHDRAAEALAELGDYDATLAERVEDQLAKMGDER